MDHYEVQLSKVLNAYRVLFKIKVKAFKEKRYSTFISPTYTFKPTNDRWRITCTSVFLRYSEDDYHLNWKEKIIPGISLCIDSQNRRKDQFHIYQIVCSILGKPEFGIVGFQSRHLSQNELRHPKFFSLNDLLKAGKETGVATLCFEVSSYAENNNGTVDVGGGTRTIEANIELLNLYSFAKANKYTDLVVKTADGSEFKAHKIVLASRSPVFDAMFTSEMQETQTGVVRIGDATTRSEAVEAMLRYIYTNVVDNLSEMAYELFELAHLYQMEDLAKLCKNHISGNICENNVTQVLELSEKYTLMDLASCAMEFVSLNEPAVVRQKEFITYLTERLKVHNVAENLLLTEKYDLLDFRESVMTFIAKNFVEVVRDSEYRKLYYTRGSLVVEVDEFVSQYLRLQNTRV